MFGILSLGHDNIETEPVGIPPDSMCTYEVQHLFAEKRPPITLHITLFLRNVAKLPL